MNFKDIRPDPENKSEGEIFNRKKQNMDSVPTKTIILTSRDKTKSVIINSNWTLRQIKKQGQKALNYPPTTVLYNLVLEDETGKLIFCEEDLRNAFLNFNNQTHNLKYELFLMGKDDIDKEKMKLELFKKYCIKSKTVEDIRGRFRFSSVSAGR